MTKDWTTDVADENQVKAFASEPYRRHIITRFHRLLETVDINEYAQGLSNELNVSQACYGDRMVCPFLRPSFITKQQYTLMRRAVQVITSTLQSLVPVVLSNADLQKQIGIQAAELELMRIEPGYTPISVTSRLDGFLNGGSCGFVEYNAESPAGLGYGDVLAQAFMHTEVMQRFGREIPFQAPFGSPMLLGAMLRCYQEWGGTKKPTIAIVDLDVATLPTRHEFYILQKYFALKGYETIIADPRELEYKDGKLCHQGKSIDILYRRVLTNEFLSEAEHEKAIVEAYRNHSMCLINSFRAKILHKKAMFNLLTDPEYQKSFSSVERDVIRAHVPWTRRFSASTTTGPDYANPNSQPIDLVSFAQRNKNRLVLKPNDSYGGRGIYLGWTLSDQEWEQGMKAALEGDYLVQARVDVERELFPTWENGQVVWGEYTIDMDPFVFDCDLACITTRLSASSLCNVTAGGGAVACFVV